MFSLPDLTHGLTMVAFQSEVISASFEGLGVILQLIATFGLFMVVKVKVWPNIRTSVVERAEHINNTIDEAESLKAESEKVNTEYQAQLEEVKQNKKDIYAQAAKDANKQRDITIAESKIRGREIIEKSQADAERSKVLIEDKIQQDMMVFVNEVAAKFISEKISDEEELKMIEDAIEGLR